MKLYHTKATFFKGFLKAVGEKYLLYQTAYNCRVDFLNNVNEIYPNLKRCNKALSTNIYVIFRYGNERNESQRCYNKLVPIAGFSMYVETVFPVLSRKQSGILYSHCFLTYSFKMTFRRNITNTHPKDRSSIKI